MADLQHNALTTAQVHEPKGALEAAAGTVYVADGLGSGSWNTPPITFSNIVEITNVSDFPTPVGGVIELETDTGYYISGNVDITPNVISIVNSGCALIGLNRSTDALITNAASPLISSTNVNVVMQGFTISNNNVAGTLLNLNNSGANVCILDKIIFGECSSIGQINTFANCIIDNCGINSVSAVGGITLLGTFGEVVIRDSYFQGWTGSLIDLGTSVSNFFTAIGCRFVGDGTNTAISGLTAAGNINVPGLGTLSNSVFAAMTTPIIGLDHADSGWFFSGVVGIQESGFVGFCSMVGNTTDTTVPAINTWTKVAGTTIANTANERFTMTDNNELTLGALFKRPVTLSANISGEKTSGTDTIEFTFFKEPAGGGGFVPVDLNTVSRSDFSGTTRSVTVTALDEGDAGDKYSVYVRNITSADDVEIENMQFVARG